MLKIQSFAVIGGDERQISMMQHLIKQGVELYAAGFEHAEDVPCAVIQKSSAADAIAVADAVILPLPVTRDNLTIVAPYAGTPILLRDTIEHIRENQIVFGGMLTKDVRATGRFSELISYDYFTREELAVRNAIPTAEGAVAIAMEELPITLNGANCLITGFGRIGKLLLRLLCGFGSKVTVCVRKKSDEAWLQAMGIPFISYDELKKSTSEYDVVFNTVPTVIFQTEELQNLNPHVLFIDLASYPGGVNLAQAKAQHIKVLCAKSLPGKVAPVTAGEIISETILNIIKEG